MDEVVIDAPYAVTQELIDYFRIKYVVHGSSPLPSKEVDAELGKAYELPEKLGMLRVLETGNPMSTQVILDRIIANRKVYEERNARKQKKAEQEAIMKAAALAAAAAGGSA